MSAAVYREHRPSAALAARVECYWTSDGEDVEPHRVLPDGCMDVLFDIESARITLVGTMTTALVVPSARRARFVGVRFRPGEAFALLGVRAADATDAALPLESSVFRSWLDELASAEGPRARVAVLDRRLDTFPPRPADARVRRAVARIFASPEERVASLAREVGASERHLERIFAERVGIGPKELARVARLRALLGRLGGVRSWADLACTAGYADQPHMIREVKRLAGVTPVALVSERSSQPS